MRQAGSPRSIAGKRFYPIQLGEKQICWLKATVRGRGRPRGDDPPRRDDGSSRADAATTSNRKPMPIHVTPIVREMVETIAAQLPRPKRDLMLDAAQAGGRRSRAPAASGRSSGRIETLLRNTVNATIVRGGEKVNVIPAEIELELDGRLLPGFTPDRADRGAARDHRRRHRGRARPARPRPR